MKIRVVKVEYLGYAKIFKIKRNFKTFKKSCRNFRFSRNNKYFEIFGKNWNSQEIIIILRFLGKI